MNRQLFKKYNNLVIRWWKGENHNTINFGDNYGDEYSKYVTSEVSFEKIEKKFENELTGGMFYKVLGFMPRVKVEISIIDKYILEQVNDFFEMYNRVIAPGELGCEWYDNVEIYLDFGADNEMLLENMRLDSDIEPKRLSKKIISGETLELEFKGKKPLGAIPIKKLTYITDNNGNILVDENGNELIT